MGVARGFGTASRSSFFCDLTAFPDSDTVISVCETKTKARREYHGETWQLPTVALHLDAAVLRPGSIGELHQDSGACRDRDTVSFRAPLKQQRAHTVEGTENVGVLGTLL